MAAHPTPEHPPIPERTPLSICVIIAPPAIKSPPFETPAIPRLIFENNAILPIPPDGEPETSECKTH